LCANHGVDHADGYRTFVNASYYSAPAAKAADGKLWFISQAGLSVVDPRRLPVQHHVRHSGTCDADERASELSRGASLALFRILQEALANALKHARARRITVALARTDDVISLAVSDDGAGFDAGRLGTSGGLGLVMMRERTSQLNGRFEFEPGHGTIIRVVVPFR
jgi:signal transduction histidine kinase